MAVGLLSPTAFGCGAEAKCPAGTQGNGCIPVTDLGEQPELPARAAPQDGLSDGLADAGQSDDASTFNEPDTDTYTHTDDSHDDSAEAGDTMSPPGGGTSVQPTHSGVDGRAESALPSRGWRAERIRTQ